MRRSITKARFPRLKKLREEELGWDITRLIGQLAGRPSIASIYRLERGESIRIAHARRVFDAINEALGHRLNALDELIIDKAESPGNTA